MVTVTVEKETDRLETPPWFFKRWAEVFNFTFDAAASEQNHLVPNWSDDSLDLDWVAEAKGGVTWLNPPYSNPGPFLLKAGNTRLKGGNVVALIKYDTSVAWYWEYVHGKADIILIPKRLRFYLDGKATEHTASFPNALLFYKSKNLWTEKME